MFSVVVEERGKGTSWLFQNFLFYSCKVFLADSQCHVSAPDQSFSRDLAFLFTSAHRAGSMY